MAHINLNKYQKYLKRMKAKEKKNASAESVRCPICKRIINQSRNLKAHMLNDHKHFLNFLIEELEINKAHTEHDTQLETAASCIFIDLVHRDFDFPSETLERYHVWSKRKLVPNYIMQGSEESIIAFESIDSEAIIDNNDVKSNDDVNITIKDQDNESKSSPLEESIIASESIDSDAIIDSNDVKSNDDVNKTFSTIKDQDNESKSNEKNPVSESPIKELHQPSSKIEKNISKKTQSRILTLDCEDCKKLDAYLDACEAVKRQTEEFLSNCLHKGESECCCFRKFNKHFGKPNDCNKEPVQQENTDGNDFGVFYEYGRYTFCHICQVYALKNPRKGRTDFAQKGVEKDDPSLKVKKLKHFSSPIHIEALKRSKNKCGRKTRNKKKIY